jgi:hypothetical protein
MEKDKKTDNDLYNIEKYSEEELFEMLDLNNPTDRELEAKLIFIIEKYDELNEPEAGKIKAFFEDAYRYFFENEQEEEEKKNTQIVEGMEDKPTRAKQSGDEYVKDEKGDQVITQTQSLEYTGGSSLNPLLKETQKRVLQLDSQFRNYGNYPNSTDYIINLSEVLNNIVSLRLHSVSIPYTWYNVSNVYNANYFYLLGNVDGIKDIYNLKFEIPAGSYDAAGLVDAINKSILDVKTLNTDIDFGTTGVSLEPTTSKISFIIDIQQIYNETNFYLYFGEITNAFDVTEDPDTGLIERQKTIPGFLGFANMVIPRFTSSNANIITPITSVSNAYSLESIYSNFQDSLLITERINTDENNLVYNSFDPNATFYLVIDDRTSDPVVYGNNYFTIYNYDGPGLYNASSTILDTIRIEFGNKSDLYTRSSLLELINRSLLSSGFLSQNAFLHQFDISYNNGDGNITTMQRFQMMVLLNRETTTKKEDSKVVVVFPDEDEVLEKMKISNPDAISSLWGGPLWTGQNSCFLFDKQTAFTSPNSLKAEINPVQTLYEITSVPKLTLRCTRQYYDNNSNNREITLSRSQDTGNPNGYILNDYIGVYNNQEFYLDSEINTKFKNIKDIDGQDITNGYVIGKSFYDVGIKRARIQFDMLTYFNEYDYELDVTNCFLRLSFGYSSDNVNITSGLGLDPPVYNNIISTSHTVTFPFTVTAANNVIIVTPKVTVGGLSSIPSYTITIPENSYRTPESLSRAINNVFVTINGTVDKSGTSLHGLNMSQSSMTITATTLSFKYVIINRITQDEYIVELTDASADADGNIILDASGNEVAYTGYENSYYDLNGNERYTVESTIDDSANVILSYLESSEPIITGNSWDALLGFTDFSYNIMGTQREIISSRDIMHDISKTILINKIEKKNDSIFLTPQSSVKGLTDTGGVKKIELSVPDGIYNTYTLYNAINNRLKDNIQTHGSIVYSTFDNGTEYSVFQISINQKYTAEDYVLSFFNEDDRETQNIQSITTNSFQTTTWDVAIGWLLGFHSYPEFDLSSSADLNQKYIELNNYTVNSSTNIVTLQGDSTLDLFLFKNLYIIVDDFTQNHLNDGLITGVRNTPNAEPPSYSSSGTRVCNPLTSNIQSSIFNAAQPGMGLTQNQLFAANQINNENIVKTSTKLYSDPPYVKDMFAMIPIKVSSLKSGDVYVLDGGTLQDNDRKYFGPVNITKLRIQLLNDHGDVINLNGSNWSFSFICEYLYNTKGV